MFREQWQHRSNVRLSFSRLVSGGSEVLPCAVAMFVAMLGQIQCIGGRLADSLTMLAPLLLTPRQETLQPYPRYRSFRPSGPSGANGATAATGPQCHMPTVGFRSAAVLASAAAPARASRSAHLLRQRRHSLRYSAALSTVAAPESGGA